MSKRLYSVLIPVYNAEPYLRECLDSVLSQTVQNFEIILVNDGSTDKSGEICDEYAKKDERIRVFHRENSGALQSRCFAIEKARGDWLLLFDADDFCDKNLIEIVDDTIEELDADMVVYGYRSVKDNGSPIYEKHGDLRRLFDDKTIFTSENKEEFFMAMIAKSRGRFSTLWCKAFRRDIMDASIDCSELPGFGGIDLVQSIRPVLTAKKIVFRDRRLYNYRLSASGGTRDFKPIYIKNFFIVRNYILAALRNSPHSSKENEEDFFEYELTNIVFKCFDISCADISKKHKAELYKCVQNNDFFVTAVSTAAVSRLSKKYQKIISNIIRGKFGRVTLRCLFYHYGGKCKEKLKTLFGEGES